MKLFVAMLFLVYFANVPLSAIGKPITEDQKEALYLKEWADKAPQEVHAFVVKKLYEMMSSVDPNSIALGPNQQNQYATCAADKMVHHLINSSKSDLLEQGGIFRANEVFALSVCGR